MRYYTLADIVIGIYTGEIEERDCFESVGGERIAYINGSLHYITTAGYVTTLVTVSEDAVQQLYFKVTDQGS